MCSKDSVAGNDIAGESKAYGIPGYKVDGSDVFAVYEATFKSVEDARKGMALH